MSDCFDESICLTASLSIYNAFVILRIGTKILREMLLFENWLKIACGNTLYHANNFWSNKVKNNIVKSAFVWLGILGSFDT